MKILGQIILGTISDLYGATVESTPEYSLEHQIVGEKETVLSGWEATSYPIHIGLGTSTTTKVASPAGATGGLTAEIVISQRNNASCRDRPQQPQRQSQPQQLQQLQQLQSQQNMSVPKQQEKGQSNSAGRNDILPQMELSPPPVQLVMPPSSVPAMSPYQVASSCSDTNREATSKKKHDEINWQATMSTASKDTKAQSDVMLDDKNEINSTSAASNTDNMTPEGKLKANCDQNREHARNTRLQKKAYLERQKFTVDELCRGHNML
eukprot:12425217-Ditylum_brightwellii.AAC.1